MSEAFPQKFILGAATSAYQIEGGVDLDGRGPSIWDTFAAQPGKIVDGTDGRNACEHYLRYPEDVALMRWLGLHAYRFSVAWPRVLPRGRGAVNQRGLDFYERLVDALLAENIAPFLTLYHWDLPQALHERGGWTVRDTAEAFADYAEVVARRLGDRVQHWITHNEPWCTAMHGYVNGAHAPGHRDWPEGLVAAHHVLLSHGLAVPRIRAHAPKAEVGITLNLTHCEPASDSAADRDACRMMDGTYNRWYLDPLHGRGYPEDVVRDHVKLGRIDADLPFVREGDLSIIAVPTDMLGINYYTRDRVAADEHGLPRKEAAQRELTDIGWEVYPNGLSTLLIRLHETYAPPRIYITENGAAFHSAPDAGGHIHDVARQRYLHGHLLATLEAARAGVPVAGYFVWSLLDNYEWAEGYTQRFGIVWVDYATQQRLPKDSAYWYRAVIREHALHEPNARA
ncbi:MAG: GH1 family beta-glucosidase [Polyangiales bacterium]